MSACASSFPSRERAGISGSGMPISWTMDPDIRVASVVATGEVTRGDVEAYVEGIVTADTVARILGIMATANRPMRLFTRLHAAERWLEGVAET